MRFRAAIRYALETLLTGPCLIGRHQLAYEPAQTVCGRTIPGFEYCPRCCMTRGVALLPDGHPDNYDGLLTDEQEAWLAEVDADLWPDDADPQHTHDAAARLARSTED